MNGISKERRYRRSKDFVEGKYSFAFLFFEGVYIFGVMPILAVAITYTPIAMFLHLTDTHSAMPLGITVGLGILMELFAIRYFIQRYFLRPYNMSFGQWLRYMLDAKKRRQDRFIREKEGKSLKQWYLDLETISSSIDNQKNKESCGQWLEWLEEKGYSQQRDNEASEAEKMPIVNIKQLKRLRRKMGSGE